MIYPKGQSCEAPRDKLLYRKGYESQELRDNPPLADRVFARLGARFALVLRSLAKGGKSRQGRRASLAELGQAGEAWAEPCEATGLCLLRPDALRDRDYAGWTGEEGSNLIVRTKRFTGLVSLAL